MHWKRWEHRGLGRPQRRRVVAAAAALATAGSLLYAAPSQGLPKPVPPSPPRERVSQGQVDAAASAKAALASQVGQLSGDIAAAKVQLQQLQGEAELAEQKYAYAYSQWQAAQAEAQRAEQAVKDARTRVARAHVRFVEYVRAMYTSGGVDGTAGSLLTADDPSAMLEQSSMASYQRQHKADAIGAMEAATVARSNADARAQLAQAAAAKAKAKAEAQRKAAQAAVVAEQQQKTELEQAMASKQAELQQKQAELARLTYGRAQTLKYLAAQRAYETADREYRAWKAKVARERAARREARREARLAAQQSSGGGGGGGGGGHSGGGGSPHSGPPAPSGGGWTPAKGHTAANRALSELGVPYAWAGGGAYGPGPGVCVPGDAWNDCNKIGFDCSGLAMYAWGGSWWPHYAASQYSVVGRYHPSAGNLMPGDLVFWSSNGAVSGIHHVAIYIGGGEIVEAPYSGSYVRVASLYEYGGFFGATRPLS